MIDYGAYEIAYEGESDHPSFHWSACLAVSRSRERLFVTRIGVAELEAWKIMSQAGLDKENEEDCERFRRVLLRYGVHVLERQIRDGDVPVDYTQDVRIIEVAEEESAAILQLIADKTCEHQQGGPGGLWCTTPRPSGSETVDLGGIGLAQRTSRALCGRCPLPDTDFTCSYLQHPQVDTLQTGAGSVAKMLTDALCDEGRPEVSDASRCRLGGHSCARRVIRVIPHVPDADLSPLSLSESLDYLDVTWRAGLGKGDHLIEPAGFTRAISLGLPAQSRDEFAARMSDLADTLKRIRVPKDRLSEGARGALEGRQDKGPLDWLEAYLSQELDENQAEEAVQGIELLRKVNRVRTSLQHASSRTQLPDALGALGIAYPTTGGWNGTWGSIRQLTTQALRQIRNSIAD